MRPLKDILLFAKNIVTAPEATFRAMASGPAAAAGPLAVYLVSIALSALFMTVRPADFPAELAQLSLPERSWGFYAAVALFWGTVFTAAAATMFLFFLRTFAAGRFIIKAAAAAAAIALLFGTAFAAGDRALILAVAGAAAVFMAYVIRKERGYWTRFFLAGLAIELAAVLAFPAGLAAALLGYENLFLAAETTAGLWMLFLVARMARAFTGAAVPRTAAAFAAALVASALFMASLHAGGVLDRETFILVLLL